MDDTGLRFIVSSTEFSTKSFEGGYFSRFLLNEICRNPLKATSQIKKQNMPGMISIMHPRSRKESNSKRSLQCLGDYLLRHESLLLSADFIQNLNHSRIFHRIQLAQGRAYCIICDPMKQHV